MRLAQAARKLSITTEDIVDFLEIRGVVIEKDSNTKLDAEAVKLLYKHFEIEETPIVDNTETDKSTDQSEIVHSEDEEDEVETKVTDIIEEEDNETLNHIEKEDEQLQQQESKEEQEITVKQSFKTVSELLEEEHENKEEDLLIKAPKVELKGLNVVGKIDLPEPKAKPDPEQKEEAKEKTRKSSKSRTPKKPRRNQKRELSPAEIRRREEQKEARKRERLEKEKKRKREKFYQEKVLKPKQQEQKNRPKKKKRVVEVDHKKQKAVPKTVLGKFWRWLNT